MNMSKAALYFWLAVIPSILAAPWIVAVYNDPSTMRMHSVDEWGAVLFITGLQALYQGFIALRALGSNPNGNGKPNETTPRNGNGGTPPVPPASPAPTT